MNSQYLDRLRFALNTLLRLKLFIEINNNNIIAVLLNRHYVDDDD
jgi:hypothetical protein